MSEMTFFAAFLAVAALGTDVVEPLPGTAPLETDVDLSMDNLARVDRYLLKRIRETPAAREKRWKRDTSDVEAYRRSVDGNRLSLRRRIGAIDARVDPVRLELMGSLDSPSVVASTRQLRIYAVRWNVFDDLSAEGLLLLPKGEIRANVVVIPDASQTPEELAGFDGADSSFGGVARRLAESGCRVLVPTTLSRETTWSGDPRVRRVNQPHREFVYRMAFFMGRHLIGYEVQQVQASIDYFKRSDTRPVGVAGFGEGGLLAFYTAAIDERVDATLVSGYFQPREQTHREPVDRNVYGLITEFADADVASLIAPRHLVIEACRHPESGDLPQGTQFSARGEIKTPMLANVRSEYAKARAFYERLAMDDHIALVESQGGRGIGGGTAALEQFARRLQFELAQPVEKRLEYQVTRDPAARMKRQYDQFVAHTQAIVRDSHFRRQEFWAKSDRSSVDAWRRSTERYREIAWRDIIGKLPPASLPPRPRTRRIYETPKWLGYEVLLDVYPDVTAYGVLLVPRDVKPGERRPVVVAQHGRGGRPSDVCNPAADTPYYHSFGAALADRGFVVFAPQNLYIGEELYRLTQRKAFALGMTFFAPMVRQHEQILAWLKTLPMVDSKRIAFYGLSYGGKSAMLIPAVLEGYALSICSGDFNEEVWKHTSLQYPFSFAFTLEHDHLEFDFGERFNYAELAGLIAPRPFMVERGHRDGVAIDEWVAFEYAKVRRLYGELRIPQRTEIEFFDGGHEIHSRGTFDFLHRHLEWPKPAK